jgi:hypothetical protein
MNASETSGRARIFSRFSAVDLVTIAALACVFRATIYLVEAIGFLFPFSTFVLSFAFGLTCLIAAAVVRKVGVFTMITIAGQLINFFLQGEMLVASLVFCLWGILADIYVYLRLKAGAKPFSNFRDMVVCTVLLAVVWSGLTYGVGFRILYLLELSLPVYIGLVVGGIVTTILGGWMGYGLGNRIKGLIG